MKTVPSEKVVLLYVCPECKTVYRQPLSELVENGTAVCVNDDCDNCDDDCDVADEIEIHDDEV